jgi:hypothetical protein
MWYMRYKQNKLVSEMASRAPQAYLNRNAVRGIYVIPMPREGERKGVMIASPPPTFSKAVNLPQPGKCTFILVDNNREEPPTYKQAVMMVQNSLNTRCLDSSFKPK